MANASEKQRIRDKYKGISQEEIEVIPAIEDKDIFEDDRPKRVGVYARVSTDDPNQTSSFELQRNHYTDYVQRHPNWHLYKIYADEGISGTSLKHRDAFLEMIEDCKKHKLDLIITKSVSRFARNIYHCIGYVRELADLDPPVGVIFETENLYTLREGTEMALSFIATLAQEESHSKSSSMNLSYEMRFRRGIFMTPELLGYDKDEDGNLVINEDEALTVRLIFFMFLYGYTVQQIAETLTQLKRVTKRGNYKWTQSSILGILQNERHCGDVLAHKTYTPNYLDHKSKKNKGKKPQYRRQNHHEKIIEREDFIAAQQLIAHGVTGRTGMLPQVMVIDKGALRGFVIINPRWTGFSAEDYLTAVDTVLPSFQADIAESSKITPEIGSIDLRGYKVVRGQFFETNNACSITFGSEYLKFTRKCLAKMNNPHQVELLFDPIRKLLVVRPTDVNNKNAVSWLYFDGRACHPRRIIGRAYLPVIFELMEWNSEWVYFVQGEFRTNGHDAFLVFDLNDAERIVKQRNKVKVVEEASIGEGEKDAASSSEEDTRTQTIMAMPQEWLTSFGNDYYSHTPLLTAGLQPKGWDVRATGVPSPHTTYPGVTGPDALREGIDSIIATIREGSEACE